MASLTPTHPHADLVNARLGLWLLIASEALLFFAFIAARFAMLGGLHALHVVSGAVLLAFVYLHGRVGRYGPGASWPVEGAVKYWHFVDVAWVFIYPTLYLVGP
jgi:heme/copper-type cytochrome/quinol oxidase subunit 3